MESGKGVGRMKLGSEGLEVSVLGLGCMGMSAFYGPPKPEPDMISLIHHAVRSGITFLDTSDMYGPFTNELLLGKHGVSLPGKTIPCGCTQSPATIVDDNHFQHKQANHQTCKVRVTQICLHGKAPTDGPSAG